MTLLKIAGGAVYDPANDVRGETRDLWMDSGRIIAPPVDENGKPIRPDRVIDATGLVVMPGGIDMHCHIVGPKVNAARRLAPGGVEAGGWRLGTGGAEAHLAESNPIASSLSPVPPAPATGRLFAAMGYTTALDAAIPGLHARAAHAEFADTPHIDKGFLQLLGNHPYLLGLIGDGRREELDAAVAWNLSAARSYGVKVVNPGGVENYKRISRQRIEQLDQEVDGLGVTPRQIVRELAASADRLALPHPVHIHCNNLGIPGNWQTTLETMKSVDGRRAHFAHVQFHSYAGDPDEPGSFSSAARQLADYVLAHENITVDVGHVHPGKTIAITGDAPFAARLRRLTGGKWFTADTENEASCGVIPTEYRPQKSLVHATQWAIALEWYLRMLDDPWRVALTSDHPNGGAFYRYPEMVHLLMDAAFRREAIARMPASLKERTEIADLGGEYGLTEIAIITRAAPARILGLSQKGHLGAGADADVTIYAPHKDKREMFARPRYVIKSGEVIVEEGEFVAQRLPSQQKRGQDSFPFARPALPVCTNGEKSPDPFSGPQTHSIAPEHDESALGGFRAWFADHYSVNIAIYPV